MLRRISQFFVKLAERWMPDPLIIGILLTFACLASAVAFTDFGPADAAAAWGVSFWNLLEFTGQMILILALGHIVAHTRLVNRGLVALSDQIRSPRMAYGGLAFTAAFCGLFSWGMALILPAVLSRIVAGSCRRRGIRVHFPLLVAAGWLGASTSMQGLSASIPLVINTPGHFLEDKVGLIGLSATIFSVFSLSILAAKMLGVPLVLSMLHPKDEDIREMPEQNESPAAVEQINPAPLTPSQRLEQARVITLSLAALGAYYIAIHFSDGGSLNLNTLNMCFVVLGLALADSPKHYLHLLGNAARVIGPFLIQYPLYAGIMGVIAISGLGDLFTSGFVAVASQDSLPVWTFLSAGLLNLFIPSAGGQWAVQGPIAVDAALQLGTDIPRIAMSLTLGESWTNAIQPLYAIPVLAVAGLHIRHIMGYGVIVLGLNGTIYLIGLLFF